MKTAGIVIILTLLLLAAVSTSAQQGAGRRGGTPGTMSGQAEGAGGSPIAVAQVSRQSHTITVGGRLEPQIRIVHKTSSSGYIQSVSVREGQLVQAAGLAFPYEFPNSHSLSLSLSFSPDQLRRDEREELAADIEIKRMEIATESYTVELQKTLGEQSVAIVEEALVSTQIQKDRDRIALQEAELLFQQGRRTTLELEQMRLNLRRTKILSFQAAAEVYRAQGNYLMLFVPAETD